MREKRILKTVICAAFFVIAGGIFFLTAQDKTSTIKITELAIKTFPGAFLLSQNTNSIATLSFTRRIAHIYEFGFLGLFASLFMVSYNTINIKKRAIITCLICFAYSLFDQIHKTFVPGREFDVRDLGFDALGYLTAISLIFICYLAITQISAKKQ